MRYAVDVARNVFYAGLPEYESVVLAPFPINAAVIGAALAVFLVAGTASFLRSERNR